MDRLRKQQMSMLSAKDRKRLYDRLQELEIELFLGDQGKGKASK
jgi:hypothetical protein